MQNLIHKLSGSDLFERCTLKIASFKTNQSKSLFSNSHFHISFKKNRLNQKSLDDSLVKYLFYSVNHKLF